MVADNANVNTENVKLQNYLPPISSSPDRATVTGKKVIPSSSSVTAPPTNTGSKVADGVTGINNANNELNIAAAKAGSGTTPGTTAVANNGNTVNNVTIINQTPPQTNIR
jgi:hypothetical protein